MAKITTALSMKLLIDTKSQRVLFAEAGKDVVDFLFSLLSLPIATAVRLIGEASMVGSVGSLYASVEGLDGTYVLPGAAKDALLRPTVAASPAFSASSSLLLPAPDEPPKSFFTCGSYRRTTCYDHVADAIGTSCPFCKSPMTRVLHHAKPRPEDAAGAPPKGFVQGIATYTVADDLAVTPMSAISSVTMLNTSEVTDLAALQEKTVQIGYAEGLEILKASLQSKTVLTDVFLGKKAPAGT